VLATLAASTLLLARGASTVRAAGVAPDADARVVASDGSTFPQVPMPFVSSPPFAGSGPLPGAATRATPASGAREAEDVPEPQSVIGTDERKQINDTTLFPYSAIVALEIAFPHSSSWTCTGFLIDADTVVTAGHCVYDAFEGGWATSITAAPGRNGSATPFGSATATKLFAVSQWVDSADPDFDYGAIRLSAPLGDAAGWLGYGVKSNDDVLANRRVRIFGYPTDKEFGTMWGMRRRIKGVAPHKLFYKADTFGGQSGSPIFGKLSNTCQPCAFGVHAYGVGGDPYPTSNSGTRVDALAFASLVFWASQ
jgi:glutamyl endopeptidase